MKVGEGMFFDATLDPLREDLARIDGGLHEYNREFLGEEIVANSHRVMVALRDDGGELIAGIHGELYWDWLHIKTLWVTKERRGQGIGRELLRRIEQAALQNGFRGSHLETTSFQALDFYRKAGYEIFGTLDGKPAGSTWYFLKKDLTTE